MQTQIPDLVTTLGLVDAEKAREFWNVVGLASALTMLVALFCLVVRKCRADVSSLVSSALKPRNLVASALAAATVIYASEKAVVPQTHSAGFRQTTSVATEPISGIVEYWKPEFATNGINVALFGGTVTQSLAFATGQFVYAFDSSTSVSVPQGLPDNKLWCRTSVTSNWTETTTHSWFNTNGHYSAAIASLPGNVSPASYQLWFVGPEDNLPPVIIEVSGGIDILNQTITANAVSVTFCGKDVRFETGSHTYYFQTRVNRGGVLTEWTNIASVTLTGGQTTGTITVNGFTVDVYHEYRIYSDLEVVQ